MILVTGGNGFVGRAVLSALVSRGNRARAAVRKLDSNCDSRFEWTPIGDVTANTDWSSALRNVAVVIHLVARTHVIHDPHESIQLYRQINVSATRRLAEKAASSGVRRFVFV